MEPEGKRLSVAAALRALGIANPKQARSRLTAAEVAQVFRASGPAQLWLTDVFGSVREKIPTAACLRFWKTEVKHRVLEEPGFAREQWPGGYAYLISEWESPFDERLLELMRCD